MFILWFYAMSSRSFLWLEDKDSIGCQVPEWPRRRRRGNPWAHHQRIGILYHRTPTYW